MLGRILQVNNIFLEKAEFEQEVLHLSAILVSMAIIRKSLSDRLAYRLSQPDFIRARDSDQDGEHVRWHEVGLPELLLYGERHCHLTWRKEILL